MVLTHLHFDHAGGTTTQRRERLRPRFEEATHWVQRGQWAWAHAPTAKDAESFRRDDFATLAEHGSLMLVDGEAEPFPGIWLHPVYGHTEAMQMIRVAGPEGEVLFASDLVPTHSHVRLPWIMAYDNAPLRTLEEKRDWLGRAVEGDWAVVFQHDPNCVAARLRSERGRPEVAERVRL